MKALLIAVAAVGLMGVTATANAQQTSTDKSSTSTHSSASTSTTPSTAGQSSTSATPSTSTSSATQKSSDSMAQSPSQSSSTSAQTGSSGTAAGELSGVVKKVDKANRSVSISSPTGGEKQLKIAKDATITRDGSQAGLDQLKEGEQVRASFDPTSNEATKLDIQSSGSEKGTSEQGEKSKTGTESKKY